MSANIRKVLFSLPKLSPRRDAKGDAEMFHVTDWPMHYFLAIDRNHVQNMVAVLQPFDCSLLSWRVLSLLADRDGHNVKELAELSVIERSTLSKLLDGMEQEGLIERTAPDGDKRKTIVFLSESGRALFEKALPSVLRYYASFLTGISPSEMTVLMKALKQIKANVLAFDVRDLRSEI